MTFLVKKQRKKRERKQEIWKTVLETIFKGEEDY